MDHWDEWCESCGKITEHLPTIGLGLHFCVNCYLVVDPFRKDGTNSKVWSQDADGDWAYDGNVVCPHTEPPRWRVAYDWGKIKVFETLDEAKAFVEKFAEGVEVELTKEEDV